MPVLPKAIGLDVHLELKPVNNCLKLENPEQYGFSEGIIAKIDSNVMRNLWDTNDQKVFKYPCKDIEQAQVTFIVRFVDAGIQSVELPTWTFTELTADYLDRVNEPAREVKP